MTRRLKDGTRSGVPEWLTGDLRQLHGPFVTDWQVSKRLPKPAGGVAEAVRRARQLAPHHLKIEVEVSNFRELEAAVGAGAELVLLDNMKLTEIKKSVDRFGDRVEFEISGGVTRENIRRLAQTGVNFISSGAIIHSARWVNIAMEIME